MRGTCTAARTTIKHSSPVAWGQENTASTRPVKDIYCCVLIAVSRLGPRARVSSACEPRVIAPASLVLEDRGASLSARALRATESCRAARRTTKNVVRGGPEVYKFCHRRVHGERRSRSNVPRCCSEFRRSWESGWRCWHAW